MTWIKVFPSVDEARQRLIPEKPQLIVVHGKRICLVLRNDKICAVEDRCPHNGESLSKGTVNYLGEVICPWHGYRYNLKTGRESEERVRDLVTYPIMENSEGVFLSL